MGGLDYIIPCIPRDYKSYKAKYTKFSELGLDFRLLGIFLRSNFSTARKKLTKFLASFEREKRGPL